MAMNMWMTISVFVVAVMATTVIGSTPSQEQERERRTDAGFCCAKRVYYCLKDNDCLPERDCTMACDVPDDCASCCQEYLDCAYSCIWAYQLPTGTEDKDPLRECHNQCKGDC
uniref:Ccr_20 putative toxin n=2 Tax=Turridae TaxID=128512 RepID=A0A098LXV5_CRACE